MDDLISAAAQFINTTSGHIFLTGKAGTGKTTFLKNLGELTHKSHIVVAPTGIAALNAGGVTIHSQFLLPPLTFLPDRNLTEDFDSSGRFINQNILARKHPLNSARRKVLRSIDLLVIDEVSMLRADLLDAIDYRMKAARGNFRESFGGVQVLFIGDLYQLPPVVKNEEWDTLRRYYGSIWFHEAVALRENPPVYIELDKIYRQHDAGFIGILNNLRNNVNTAADIEALNRHYKSPDEISSLREVITLTTHNYKAEEINQKELRKLSTTSCFFDALIEGDFPESMFPVLPQLELKVGAQIMFVRNDNVDKMYFNGKLATVTEISDDDVWVEMAESHARYQLKLEKWENKKYTVSEGAHELKEDVIGTFEQYPVRLAWAITVHKSQGLTFDKAIIDVGQAFADGQVYVAMSRLRTLEGLVLRTPINPAVISTDKQVVAYAQQNHRPGELGDVMKVQQQQYIRQLIQRTFEFTSIVRDIRHIQKNHAEEGFDEGSMKPVLVQVMDALEAEQTNTEKFRMQLTGLSGTDDPGPMLERMRKGSAYYRNLVFQNIRILLLHIEVMRQRKRVKTYLTQLTDLEQALTRKLWDIDRVSFLTEAILRGFEKPDFTELDKVRAAERAQLLADIRKETGTVTPVTAKRKPRAKKTRDPAGRSTFDITLDLLDKGMTIDQIAAERGLVAGTIEGHLAKAVGEGRLSIFKFISEEAVEEILRVRSELPEGSTSKGLYEALNGKFGYGLLRAVASHASQLHGSIGD